VFMDGNVIERVYELFVVMAKTLIGKLVITSECRYAA